MELTLDQALQKGIEAHKAGKIQEADRYYTAILKANPKHSDANHNMGVLAVGIGKVEQALPFFKSALETNATKAQYWLSYIDALIRLDRMADAKAVLEQAKSKGAKGDRFDQIEKQLASTVKDVEVNIAPKKLQEPSETQIQPLIDMYTQGQYQKALNKGTKLLEQFPNSINLYNIIGAANNGLGKFDEAIKAYGKAVSIKPDYAEAFYNMGVVLNEQGKLDNAIATYNKAIAIKPHYAEVYNNISNALQEQGKLEEAIDALKKAISIKPNYADAYYNMGIALKEQGNMLEAIDAYIKVISIKPDYAEAHYNMGITLKEQRKPEEAIEAFKNAISIKPDYAEAHNNIGITLKEQGKPEEAIEAFKNAISIKPDFAEIHNNIGNALKDQGKIEEAIKAYYKALSIKPDYAEAHNNMGVTFKEHGKIEEALEAYYKALSIKPDYAEAYNNIGNALFEQGKLKEAIEACTKALAIKPDYAKAYYNMGSALQDKGRLKEALYAFNRAINFDPNLYSSYSSYLHLAETMCEWKNFESSPIREYLAKDMQNKIKYPMLPFLFLHIDPKPEIQLITSRLFSINNFKKSRLPIIKKPKLKPEKLRIGYFSPDFNDHPVAQMIEGVFRHHDRSKFEIFAYSIGKNLDGVMLQKIKNNVDTFRDLQSISGTEIALLARGDQINIAIDLAGYTKNNKAELFNQRSAPIQINFLGYPGTMGADFMDYIIADKILIPPEIQSYYSEKIIFMPNSYQPTNDQLTLAKDIPTKKELGLPEKAFVFCAINQSYKIKTAEFDIWMRLLSKVKGSVLWLKSQNRWMVANLQNEAQKRGIDSSRLIFAKRIAHEKYLAQFKRADLYLDTFNYNAGTTASDVLMAGLPIVTKMGKTYASRMAASLLNAAGMQELITKTAEEYENLALELAVNSSKLSELRERLQKRTKTSPIFNTKLYTRNLEAGYEQAYDRYYYSNSVQNIDVSPYLSSETTGVSQ